MPTYNNIDDYISTVPKYMQPKYMKLFRLFVNDDHDEYLWNIIENDIPIIELINLEHLNWDKLRDILLCKLYNNMSNDKRFIVTDKIYDLMIINLPPDELICCDNCGNVWDGFAQCLCHNDDYD